MFTSRNVRYSPGRDLEMIEKVGWDQLEGLPVANLPTPIQGQGQKQSLQLSLPDPVPPHASLYLWLRGEKDAAATTFAPPPKTTSAAAPVHNDLTRSDARESSVH